MNRANPGAGPGSAGILARRDRCLSRRVKALGPAVKGSGRGRLIFALDATMSRQPTWDQACVLQADMFREAAAGGGLDIQLVYYRGLAECRASPWVAEPERLGELMSRIDCRGGHTQIAKILAHARRENDKAKIGALVFVGDAMEESLDDLCAGAGELGLRNVPAFMFQEGYDPVCEQAFREIARLTRGAYCRFAPGAAHELAELLRAAAAYAAGGMKALADLQARRSTGAVKLIEQLKVAMPLLLGIVVLILLLWAVNAFSKADPKQAARLLRSIGGAAALLFAAFLLFRGEIGLAVPVGARRARAARLDFAVAGELRRPHAEKSGPGVARALGLCRDGARSRQRRDARPHSRRRV